MITSASAMVAPKDSSSRGAAGPVRADTPLLIINSIGLTGAEILTAELVRHPAIRFLPGQNFIGLQRCLYRENDFGGMGAEEIFAALSAEYCMTSGRVWSGLTKDMSAVDRAKYDRPAHCSRFVGKWRRSSSLLDHARVFASTYFDAESSSPPDYLGFFGQNLVLSHGRELLLRRDYHMLACTNRIDLWLSTISQRMTWDCRKAAKFWIVNHLILESFARAQSRYMAVDLERLVDDRPGTLKEIWKRLGLKSVAEHGEGHTPSGFIQFNARIFEKIRRDAGLLSVIYGDAMEIRLGRSLHEWAPEFLARAENVDALERYRAYWNSTSHTNFDWIGPIEEEIFERAAEVAGCRDGRNLSLDFYHRYNQLSSLTHDKPVTLEPQALGVLEEQIVVPLLPFFLKICIEHLTNLARIAERQAHSYRTLRGGALYARLKAPEAAREIERLALVPRIAALEEQIARTEEKVGHTHAPERARTQST